MRTKKAVLFGVLFIAALAFQLAAAPASHADVTYNYTGDDYNVWTRADASVFGQNLTLSVTFASYVSTYTGLIVGPTGTNGIVSWTATSGLINLSSATGVDTEGWQAFQFTNGAITQWFFYGSASASPTSTYLDTIYYSDNSWAGNAAGSYDYVNYDWQLATYQSIGAGYGTGPLPGTWTTPSASSVPLPGALLFLSSGMLSVAGFNVRKKLSRLFRHV